MRCIDADHLIGLVQDATILGDGFKQAFTAIVRGEPTIEERKTGKWIKNSNGTYSCDKCHSWIPNEQHYYANFCLYCGADMRGEEP